MARLWALLAASILMATFAACSSNSGQNASRDVTDQPPARDTATPPAGGLVTPPTMAPTAEGGTLEAPTALAVLSPTLPAATTATPAATPFLNVIEVEAGTEEEWVRDRVNAAMLLYGITSEGAAALRTLDVRWMQDQPGFFGSYGYKSWAGVGEAKPATVMHELSHSYWGLFPITGFADLSWDASRSGEIPPALQKYHQDVLLFMAQPPDPFEPLRARLRNLPRLSAESVEPLIHTIEADAIYNTGGDLNLIPPVLRKYWHRLLAPGPFGSWHEAIGWYESLDPQEKRTVDTYLGFQHLDLREYGVAGTEGDGALFLGIMETVVGEETQRLRDFVEVFDLLLGVPETKEDFNFWRRYLRDKIELHRRHPGLVAALDLPRSADMVRALDFLAGLDVGGAEEKALAVVPQMEEHPFLVHFLPALDNRTLLVLFSSDALPTEGATLKGTAAFVESLQAFTPHVDRIVQAAEEDISLGTRELERYLNSVDFEEKREMELFFEIFEGSGETLARRIVGALDDSTLRRLIVSVPVKLRALLEPPRFLEFLDVTSRASLAEMGRGITDMVEHPSGNYIIDEPFLDAMYSVVAARARANPRDMLEVLVASPFPMERFIRTHPAEAVEILSSDVDTALDLVRAGDPVLFSPARFLYRVAHADPEFAADLVARLDPEDDGELVVETLAQFAYDFDRQDAFPQQPISIDLDSRFFAAVLDRLGHDVLESRLKEIVELYSRRISAGESPEDFLAAYERTLRAVTTSVSEEQKRLALERIVDSIFP